MVHVFMRFSTGFFSTLSFANKKVIYISNFLRDKIWLHFLVKGTANATQMMFFARNIAVFTQIPSMDKFPNETQRKKNVDVKIPSFRQLFNVIHCKHTVSDFKLVDCIVSLRDDSIACLFNCSKFFKK